MPLAVMPGWRYNSTMPEEHANRRLAAILAADVVGYSKMMAADEGGTLAALRAHREGLFNPAVERHGGRIVKLMGDGTLVEFSSVVDAVRCALDIQLQAAKASEAASSITLRIGINLGDVVIDGDDIYGDGVNIAARLEPLADPGGICIASIVNESVGGRIDVGFEDGGEVSVKNIDRPIRVWKWRPAGEAEQPAASPWPPAPPDGKAQASIAVLPFDNMSGDPEQEYFSDGITEDIITDLSKVAGLLVIARNSSFAYKGKSPDIRTVGRELGVNSVLEGSIRRAADRVRITAQLIDTGDGAHLWAERFDRDLTDIFAVQDEVTRKIVDALKVALSPGEVEKLENATGTSSVEAHDCFLKGRELMARYSGDTAMYEKAREQFERAVELDPRYGDAWAGLGMYYGYLFNNTWAGDRQALLQRADDLASKAVELAPSSVVAQYVLSMTAGFSGDYDRSKKAVDAALAISPSNADALLSRGALLIFTGQPQAAFPDLEQAIRLDPARASQFRHFLGIAHILVGNHETAAAQFRERILLNPETDLTRAMLAATLGQMGEIEEAKKVWAELKAINPDYSFEMHMGRLPWANPEDAAPIAAGLRKAGLIT